MGTKTGEIFDDLKDKIMAGIYANMAKLPTEQALMDYYAASRNTVRNVLKELEVEGLIYSIQGSGYYAHEERVIDSVALRSLGELTSTRVVRNEVLLFERVEATHELASIFKLELNSRLYHFRRLRYQNNILLRIEEAYMPFYLFPTLSKRDLEGSVLDYVEKTRNFGITYAIREFASVLLRPEEKRYFTLPESAAQAGMKVTSTSYLDIGKVFEYSVSISINETHTDIARRH